MPVQLPSRVSPAQAWSRALERTARISANPGRVLPLVIDEVAARMGNAPALLSDGECLSYRDLVDRSNRYARWAIDQGIAKGGTVCLLMPNRPEYLAIWLGVTRVGGVVALVNMNLSGPALAYSVNIAAPRHVIVDASLADALRGVRHDLTGAPRIWIHGGTGEEFPSIDLDIEDREGHPLAPGERRPVTIDDRALYIYTSGTTGLPKAAVVSHARLMQWSEWFAGMMDASPADRLYDCLPMYHSVGGVLATGAMLVSGGSTVLPQGFSASQFWSDVVRWNCTLVQYIGELCRYLLHTERSADETRHAVRMFCGNGLRPDIWEEFQRRFEVPNIFEFYAATEGNVSFFNIEGKVGAVGRIPPYLAHRFPSTLVKFDYETEEPVRDGSGFCVRCGAQEVGEAIGQILEDRSNVGGRFDGYSSAEASRTKVLRDVFTRGDAWFRTGDLMRRDEKGYFYFVDRAGDTFRWKGENVATLEVSEALSSFRGVRQANVYGVAVPGADGRAGMAALVADGDLDLGALRKHVAKRLPEYARPMFLRIRSELDVTATFKYTKTDFVRQGFDPRETADPIYFSARDLDRFVRLDAAMFDRICRGEIQL
jgi:fatty-acyl-CoA synthase